VEYPKFDRCCRHFLRSAHGVFGELDDSLSVSATQGHISKYFTRTKVFFPPAVSEQGNVDFFADQCYDSEGGYAWPAWWIDFTIVVLNENSFKGYEKDLQSVTQVETSVVGVYGERM